MNFEQARQRAHELAKRTGEPHTVRWMKGYAIETGANHQYGSYIAYPNDQLGPVEADYIADRAQQAHELIEQIKNMPAESCNEPGNLSAQGYIIEPGSELDRHLDDLHRYLYEITDATPQLQEAAENLQHVPDIDANGRTNADPM